MKYNYDIVKQILYKSRNKDYISAADNMLKNNIFTLPPYGKLHINIENNFECKDNSRSLWRLIHGHTFLGDLFDSYVKTSDIEYVKFAEKILFNWFQYVDNNKDDKMIFHDETTALRLTYWLNFNYYCREVLSRELILKLDTEIDNTVKLLSTDKFHSTNTNHGMFQDISLLAYSLLYYKDPTQSAEYLLAIQRLNDYFKTTFTLDGVHKEHSPDYHYLVTMNVKKIVEVISDLKKNELSADEKELIDIYKNAESYAIHIVQPNFYLPKISDCRSFQISNNSMYNNLYNSDEYKFIKSHGKEGVSPNKKQVLFKDAGYFISRSNWSKESTYFLFLASYNALYHKHSDDLSFLLYDNGDVFIDSGPNGYDYNLPLTKYAYSSFAHSSLIVNNTSLPRNDKKFESVGISESEFDENGDTFQVTGFNKRYKDIKHIRQVEGNNKNKSYIINDTVTSTKRNEYQLLYQLSSEVSARINGNIISIYSVENGEKRAEIEISFDPSIKYYEIKLVSGQMFNQKSYEFPSMGRNRESTTVVIKYFNEFDEVKVTSKIELKNFKVNETIVDNEQVYGISNIKYNYLKAKKQSDSLLVIFSAMVPKYEYKFNYFNTLKDININQLYIKDDHGEYGNYYIGVDKNRINETEIISLILNIISKYNIQFDNVTLLGSSKGGFGALYFGIKYGFKNIISGAPQTLLGNFVIDEAPHGNVAEIMSGGTDQGDKLFLNNILYNVKPTNRDYSNYFLCVGTKDHHYNGHIMPFFKYLNYSGVELKLDEIPNSNHADLKLFFKDYIYMSLNKIYGLKLSYNDIAFSERNLYLRNYNVQKLDSSKISIQFDIEGKDINIVYYILNRSNEVIFKSKPQREKNIVLEEQMILGKRLKLYIRNKASIKKYISPIIREIEALELKQTI